MATTDLPGTARVVIIGGGAVGTSVLYHLALAGWTDTLLLERDELTAGSTWHAAGNCPNFAADAAIMAIQGYSTNLYRSLGEATGYPINYHVSGAVRLAHTRERMQEFAHVAAMGRAHGMEMEVIGLDGLKARHPFMETHDLAGGLWDPWDGDIDPAQLTQAFARGARERGATIRRNTPVTGIDRAGGEWIVKTAAGEVRAEIVINAAGYYARRVAEWFRPFGGRDLPMVVMGHQYLLSEDTDEIAAWSAEHGGKIPILRDVDSSYYLRQDRNGFNLGPYEATCRAYWIEDGADVPEDFSFQLFEDDLDRIEWHIEDACARVPLLAQAGISKVINGPIPYAPDGLPLIGPMPGVPNAWEACAFTFGIAQAGGAGKALADWITEGAPEWDMWSCDPRRFTGHADRTYARKRGMETYGHEYAMHFPWRRFPAGRDAKLSPSHAKLLEMGAVTVAANGWERAAWFAASGDDVTDESTHAWHRDGPWTARVRAECAAVRDGVGVLDLPGFSRFRLSGDGAASWLSARIAGRLPKVGRVGLSYFPDARGRVVTEMTVLRDGDETFSLITAAPAQWHDREWLAQDLAPGLTLEDETDGTTAMLVTGPEARTLLTGLGIEADLSRPWLSHQPARVLGHAVTLARVSFAGELGWEVHGPLDAQPDIYAALLDGGATPFGMWALDSMRIEKGYRNWKSDLTSDYTLLESGLDRFVDWDHDFRGRDALLAERAAGPARRFAMLEVDAGPADAPPNAPVMADGRDVGAVTSGAWGHRTGKSLALAVIDAGAGETLSVEIFGEARPARIVPGGVAYDPKNERIRA
ncbi:MAG: FAD-dependent oxidoreductase [Pseudomonadota bacterium]